MKGLRNLQNMLHQLIYYCLSLKESDLFCLISEISVKMASKVPSNSDIEIRANLLHIYTFIKLGGSSFLSFSLFFEWWGLISQVE